MLYSEEVSEVGGGEVGMEERGGGDMGVWAGSGCRGLVGFTKAEWDLIAAQVRATQSNLGP